MNAEVADVHFFDIRLTASLYGIVYTGHIVWERRLLHNLSHQWRISCISFRIDQETGTGGNPVEGQALFMRKLAVYGKGGIGKSTIVSNLCALYAMEGKRTLQVGCDPKADSTIAHCENITRRTVIDVLRDRRGISSLNEIIMKGRNGIDCIESGGPRPGVGCGGRGILRMIEVVEEFNLITEDNYDVITFDVLGDVVCGGFAAPLKMGLGELVVIVVSEEGMAMYAANNIVEMVREYADNGIALGGLIANLKNNQTDKTYLEKFAEKINTSILGYVPHDALFKKASRQNRTVVEIAPDSYITTVLRDISQKIAGMQTEALPAPTPMSNDEVLDFIRNIDEDI